MKFDEFQETITGILQKVRAQDDLTSEEMVALLLQQLLEEENVPKSQH
ncbi:MAG: hypothetical protein HYV97_13895 [Bdellovibrio sp.]|nr:hypothetical protein [Bdellovibrio sp.]